jgi:DNA modification methylase
MAETNSVITDQYAIYHGDCIEHMREMPDNSIHLSIYSPPFAGLYHYSSSERDLSNCKDYDEFMEHYEYVVREIYRLTPPGRISCVHCTDISLSNSGGDCLMDLPGDRSEEHTSELQSR